MIFTSGFLKKQSLKIRETLVTLGVAPFLRFIKIMCTFCEMSQCLLINEEKGGDNKIYIC
ncbi:hypothetical protein CD148_00880 [Staphylococcus delphini]|uniref:Uncharacterized protein n=1 Tax=Staphylococcus delphini TaxID=53344 RepID=A0AAX0QWB2_9STAP|nr:hypothetical protein B5C07_01435 [Staphylococcus delphini]PNZ96378.1 hypothetical protein CD148_00880 [Staphylococcus delphini]RIZ54864.1 hypothetical protein CDL68_03905 [Staphylococcus delphini]